MACGVCARSTRRAASLPGEGSDAGWQISDAGREFLALLETPIQNGLQRTVATRRGNIDAIRHRPDKG